MKLPRVTALFVTVLLLLLGQPAAAAATGLASSTALPTAQITGIVWATTTVGDTVYTTGRFTKARPSGVAAGGPGEVARANIVAFSISTGKLTSFTHTLDAEGKSITASADGHTLFVGGLFSRVDGKPRPHLAAFSIATGALLPTYYPGPSGPVYAMAAHPNGTLYVGGAFSKVGTASRGNLAAFTPAGVLDPAFGPTANGRVAAMVLTPGSTRLVVGGSFSILAGAPAAGLSAVSATTGAHDPAWAATRAAFPLAFDDPTTTKRGVTALTTDGTQIYGSAFNYLNAGAPGAWEGTFAVSPSDGHLVWGNNCHGDSYDVWPMRGVLYSVSHAHDCTAVGAWPETTPLTNHRAMASTTTVDGVNVCGVGGYACYAGMPRSTVLTQYAPVLNTGTYSGAAQAAWTVTGNSSYVVLGGEFTKVNGVAQQGLTRMAIG